MVRIKGRREVEEPFSSYMHPDLNVSFVQRAMWRPVGVRGISSVKNNAPEYACDFISSKRRRTNCRLDLHVAEQSFAIIA